jgi:Fatty acid hydroxylase
VKPQDDSHALTSLAGAAREFMSRPGPRIIAAKAAASWARRATLGPVRWREVGVAAGVLAWWPFQEWLAHRYLLHLEPFEVAGQRIDPSFARVHRAHHRQPRDIGQTLLPLDVLGVAIVASAGLWHLACRDRRIATTGMATYASAALVYEWTHYLVHTGYKPRSGLFSRIRGNHRNHHYKNEAFWLGFTVPQVDAWLGTEPDPRDVPRSPTARNLHGMTEVEA